MTVCYWAWLHASHTEIAFLSETDHLYVNRADRSAGGFPIASLSHTGSNEPWVCSGHAWGLPTAGGRESTEAPSNYGTGQGYAAKTEFFDSAAKSGRSSLDLGCGSGATLAAEATESSG